MKVQFDAGLVARYDRPGPRYTSYPTAVQFLPSVGEAAYGAAVASPNAGGGPLSLYVHVPLSFGLLAALIAHVLSVFIYW